MDDILSWWNNLDKRWQIMLLLNLELELNKPGIKVDLEEHNWNEDKLKILLRTSPLIKTYEDKNEISEDYLIKLVNLKFLIIPYAEIPDLKPVSRFNKLEILDCSHNNINNIEPLEELSNLEVLNISFNNIVSLQPLKNLSALKKFFCVMNNIMDLSPIRNHKNLEVLSCSYNWNTKMTSELLFHLNERWINLKSLDADNIIDIQKLPELYPELEHLTVRGLQGDLSTISKLRKLKYLDVSRNQIATLYPLIELTNLKYLNCDNNLIESLEPVSHLKNLEILQCDYNYINDLSPLNELVNLENLSLEGNKINGLEPLKNLRKLNFANFNHTEILPEEMLAFRKEHPICEITFK